MAFLVDYREFLHLVLLEHFPDVFPVGFGVQDGDEPFGGHHVLDEKAHVRDEADVTVGDDAHQTAFGIRYGDAADVVVLHQGESIADGLVLVYGDRVRDHSVLGALHLADLGGLLGYAHVLVDDADAAFPREGDGHRSLRHRIHCSGHDGDVEGDVAGKTGLEHDLPGEDFGIGRDEKDIIERKAFQSNSIFYE